MGRIISFTDLSANQSLSVTGRDCALNCRHCNKKFLKPMCRFGEKLKPKITSILISGGCDKDGKVPILKFTKEIKQLKSTYKINAHVGLVDSEEAQKIARIVDTVSFDFVSEPRIIKEIYKLDKKLTDYYQSLRNLQKVVEVYPHITLGLWKGRINWEYEAVDLLVKKFGFGKIIFNVFIPTAGSELERQEPPTITSLDKYFQYLKINYPRLDKRLGCMRPGGKYREKLDELALLSGFKVITRPSKKVIELAQNLGYKIFWQGQCCTFR